MVWLDGLDFPLVTALHQVMQERFPERRQPIEKSSEGVTSSLGSSIGTDCRGGFLPLQMARHRAGARALTKSPAARNRFDGYLLEYRNPVTGGPTMTTIQCAVQLLPAKVETESHRHTSTVMYHVFRGQGATQIGEQRFEWQKGDTFVVPLWYAHRHMNSSADDAILFLHERCAGAEGAGSCIAKSFEPTGGRNVWHRTYFSIAWSQCYSVSK